MQLFHVLFFRFDHAEHETEGCYREDDDGGESWEWWEKDASDDDEVDADNQRDEKSRRSNTPGVGGCENFGNMITVEHISDG